MLGNRISIQSCCVFLLFALGIALGYAISTFLPKPEFIYKEIRSNSSNFKFTNPLLQCDQGGDYISSGEKRPRGSDIQDVIDNEKTDGHITYASVYYRDLNNGPWLGIHESEKFFPASLMKLPVMIYFLKQSESDPSVLLKTVDGQKTPQLLTFSTYFTSQKNIDPQKTYTIGDLIESMILYSDNKAANNLVSVMPNTALMKVLSDLYIDSPSNPDDDYISVKNYSTFFRVLYNSSYLSQNNSEKALKMLSETDFDQGLKKYLPKDVVVAHKFGEHEIDLTNEKQLHDCGIIYYPGQPYLLCVMTRGKNMDDMANAIGLISKTVYEAIDDGLKK